MGVLRLRLSAVLRACVCVEQEEEMRRAAEEKQRAEDEEAAKWMNMISVQDTVGVEGCGMAAAGLDVGQDLALCDKHTQVRVMIDVTPCGCPWP